MRYLEELARELAKALPEDLKPLRRVLEAVGWILEELRPLLPNEELAPPALLDLGRENLRDPDAVGVIALELDELLLPPNLLDFDAGTAVTVGVKSLLVIVVALLGPPFFLLGANVGRGLDANGLITGVNVRFLDWKVKRDFVRPPSSSSSSTSSFSSVVLSSSGLALSLSDPSITTGDGEMGEVVAFISWSGAFVGEGEIPLAEVGETEGVPTIKLEVLSIICAYLPSITVPKTLDWYNVVVSFCTMDPSMSRTRPVLCGVGVSVAKEDCLSLSTCSVLVLSMTCAYRLSI